MPPGEILSILLRGGGANAVIVRGIRMPRIAAAALLGGALALSGFLLQTFFSNPIAGPFILGISSGAKLVLSLTLTAFLSRGIAAGSLTLIAAADEMNGTTDFSRYTPLQWQLTFSRYNADTRRITRYGQQAYSGYQSYL